MTTQSATPVELLADAHSRLAVREFAIQTTIGLSLIVTFALLQHRPPGEIEAIAVKVFAIYGIVDSVRALRARETVGGSSLNRWDQAAGYALCAALFNLLLSWPA